MSRLWVPPKANQELRAANERATFRMLEMVHRKGVMDDFNRDLKKIDKDLELIWAPESADAPGLKPGRWHVMRHIPGAPPSLIPVTGPNGEYQEPNSALFEKLKQMDLQNERSNRERKRQQEIAEQVARRRKAQEDEERREELRDRLNAAMRTSVSMNRDARWSQNVAGRRGSL